MSGYSTQVQTEDGVFDVDLSVRIIGRHIPASRFSPGEDPDVEWGFDSIKDEDGFDVDDEDVIKRIQEVLDDRDIVSEILIEASESAAEARADYLMDRMRDEGY